MVWRDGVIAGGSDEVACRKSINFRPENNFRMVILFLGNIDLLGSLVFMTPIAITVFYLARRFFSKRLTETNSHKILLYSAIATLFLTPLVFAAMVAIIIFSVIYHESHYGPGK